MVRSRAMADMTSLPFHPAVSRWFGARYEAPTPPQAEAWPAIASGENVLVCAPTGSGKTLAAFLAEIDRLARDRAEEGGLPDRTRVVYVSPLKALGNDIRRNLEDPLVGIAAELDSEGGGGDPIRAGVRTGDTTPAERRAMIRRPPHILVTTPESLYLLVTSESGRKMLSDVESVIVDEIHTMLGDRRGAHLAVTLERLEALAGRTLRRIGLSATVRTPQAAARFLVGSDRVEGSGLPHCRVVRADRDGTLDLDVEIPDSGLDAVMPLEVQEEVDARLAELVAEHRSTLVFVNTRRMAERLTARLAERLEESCGKDVVTSHHGSLSAKHRLEAEARLKRGELRALVATASLELGIDIGAVDLVCQVGTTAWISTFLQRVGRANHRHGGTPKGRIFPMSRDELVQAAALLASARDGVLDEPIRRAPPLDVLAQQVVAEVGAREEGMAEEELLALVRRAWPFRELERQAFDEVVEMLAVGYTTRRGRRGALLHRDGVHGRLRPRRGVRTVALTSGGAIPDRADYRVVEEPGELFVGTVDEDFAVESLPGDVMQLGNTSWRILRIQEGTVRVEDAKGQPPSVPFWFGEAPARSDELSGAVSEIRRGVETALVTEGRSKGEAGVERAVAWVADRTGMNRVAAEALVEYLAAARAELGFLPTRDHVAIERFFDASGGMQLVVHSPFGSRLNRAWGLALRKRFCRRFDFELQAAAGEDAFVLSLGEVHSFPLEEVVGFLDSASVRGVLVQALLDTPVFTTRWRWNANRALAVRRHRSGRRNPPAIQRMEAEDLVAAVFPEQLACLENIAGDREVPDHPLVRQTIDDCLVEATDAAGLERLLDAIESGAVSVSHRELPQPSLLAHEILNARPYAFLDDAPLEERRARAAQTRSALPRSADELGALDRQAIERVRQECRLEGESADELHDALLTCGLLPIDELGGAFDAELVRELLENGRATRVTVARPDGGAAEFLVPAERLAEIRLALEVRGEDPEVAIPDREARGVRSCEPSDVRVELVRARLEIEGPTTVPRLAGVLALREREVAEALGRLESEGFVLRGSFEPGRNVGEPGDSSAVEWCARRLLARIHRLTIGRLRSEIEPVDAASYYRFLLAWQRVTPSDRLAGREGLSVALGILDGFVAPAAAWEPDLLAARVEGYEPAWLDELGFTGRLGWLRAGSRSGPREGSGSTPGPVRSTPVALFDRARPGAALAAPHGGSRLGGAAVRLLETLSDGAPRFATELVRESGLLDDEIERGLAELVAAGHVTSDAFAGLRALLAGRGRTKSSGVSRVRLRVRRGPGPRSSGFGLPEAGSTPALARSGRWWCVDGGSVPSEGDGREDGLGETRGASPAEVWAPILLRRYGVVVRRLLMREASAPPWRDLVREFRRLEDRGDVRGGRFVAGRSGEQFALPEAVAALREARRSAEEGQVVVVSAADPLNLVGILTPGPRVPAILGSRLALRDGTPVSAWSGGKWLRWRDGSEALDGRVQVRPLTPPLAAHYG